MMMSAPMYVGNQKEGPINEGKAIPFSRGVLTLGISSENGRVGCSDGSLPTSPVSDCEDFNGYQSLEKDTVEIVNDFLQHYTGLSRTYGQHRNVVQTMRRVVDSLVVKHELVYKGMLAKLNMEKLGDDMSVIRTVATDVFGDGITNWGRITSLLAFGAVVCQHQNKTGKGHCVTLVGQEISSYLLSNKRDWLLKNNGWDGFVEFFQVPDPESKMRNALMAFVTVAGLGAGIAFFTR